jgi:tRNA modification GTPase trmE
MAAGTALGDTIVAIATAPASAAVGILRLSGTQAGPIAERLAGPLPAPRQAAYRHFRDAAGEIVDDGLLLWFPAPGSYTGEAVAELQSHGSPAILDALLQAACRHGARPAQPGEFTQRAYLNGRLDLLQAEAVADLVAAGSLAAARAARRSLDGEFSRRVQDLQTGLTAARVRLEAGLDFPDEDDPAAAGRPLLDTLALELDALLAAARRGERLNRGLHVVITGAPNVGKSSLLNALAGAERAIVTEIAGTTRDVLRERLMIDGIELTLADTAGLRDSGDRVEAEGVRRARAELGRADLVLEVVDDEAADSAVGAPSTDGAERVCIVNKLDLRADARPRLERIAGQRRIHLSARSGVGLDLLRDLLREAAGLGESTVDTLGARQRHLVALERVRAALGEAQEALAQDAAELAAESLRQAQQALDELTGRHDSEALLGEIFSRFCIGK